MTARISTRRRAVAIAASAAMLLSLSPVVALAAAAPERVAINDNRVPAGTLEANTLTVRLEVRAGDWRPDGDADPGINVLAFAIEGATAQIPGPLIRVTEGTEVRAIVRNPLDEPLILHGMSARAAKGDAVSDAVTIAPGSSREFRFVAATPGTYYYWAATSSVAIGERSRRDSQLSGAFLVDPKGARPRDERVFVIGVWADPAVGGVIPLGSLMRMVMNGKSWPHTERLTYGIGDTVHLRLINAGAAVHPMHLHGFYFNVDSRGDEQRDVIFPADGSPHLVNTERLAGGRTFSLTWKPTRPGNWLFHCHDTAHILQALPVDGSPAPPSHHVTNHALEMMSGPVVGITIRDKTAAKAAEPATRRQLRLIARVDDGGTAEEPAYGFALEDGRTTTPAKPPYLPGPTIVLTRNEPVTITVVNQLPEPTAIHWHGIELESYYDGVAGFAGSAARLAPAIAPGASFEARFTPPRAGTFIYHTHVDEGRQQKAGLTGALLVVDSPASYDPSHDFVFLVTVPRRDADSGTAVLLNGSLSPPARELRVGERYRLRFVNIHTFRPSMQMRVMRGDTVLSWRALAKDGMDLPPDQAVVGPSTVQMGNGETYDFEFTPDAAGDLRVDIVTAAGSPLQSMPLRVR